MSNIKSPIDQEVNVNPLSGKNITKEVVSLKDYQKTAPFSFNKSNYKLLLIGLVINVMGYILMIGGANEDPNVFDGEMFSTMRITIAPMFIVAGFGIIIYSIMKKPKTTKE